MLHPNEVGAGQLDDFDTLALMLPRSRYEDTFLLAPTEAGKMAIFIGQNHRFHAFPCSGNANFKGMIIPDVAIEFDEKSVFNPDNGDSNAGDLIRRGPNLSILVRLEGGHSSQWSELPFLGGLPAIRDNAAVGFKRWCITLGVADNKRELLWVEPPKATAG